MTTETTPLLFPEVLGASRLDELTTPHGLTQDDLDWLHHTALPSHALRIRQTPAMHAETILLTPEGKAPIPLAGCFTLSTSPSDDASSPKRAFLYTPHGGLAKFPSLTVLEQQVEKLRQTPEGRDELFRFLSIAQRNELNGTTTITTTRQRIDADVFEAQIESIEQAQRLNAQAMVDELVKQPSLASMLDHVLGEVLPNIDHRQARVALVADVGSGDPKADQLTRRMSLSDALLVYFHNQGRPVGHDLDLIHPAISDSPHNTQQWESILRDTARNLIPRLTLCIDSYWNTIGPFHASRRTFLYRVIGDALRARILISRERKQITAAQSQELLRLYRSSRPDEPLLFIETVRLWEYKPLFVELAGALMISGKEHYLYTPGLGLQTVDNYLSFKDAFFGGSTSTERKEALYGLLSLEERNRFLRFDAPQVSGQSVAMPVLESLGNAIIDKQAKNLHFALEMSRQGDMDIHALVDKALDIRTLINPSLLKPKIEGHWNTQPAFYGDLQPSNFKADRLARKIKSYTSVEAAFNALFTQLPQSTDIALDHELKDLVGQLTSVFSQGIRAEAELRELNGTLAPAAHDLVRGVFAFDSDYPDRSQRIGVKGFRPDVYWLKLSCNADGKSVSLPLANCLLLTERGGLDTPYSGMAILWTPANGLQAFPSVETATRQLNRDLLDSRRRFGLLANLNCAQRKPHGRYQLETFELIEDNVLLNRMNSFITWFEAEHDYLRTLKIGGWQLTGPTLVKSLQALVRQGAPTNLPRATHIAQANRWQQKLPAWLGTAPLEDQRLHIDLLEQCRNSMGDGQDYLDGIEPLPAYVEKKLKALLGARFDDKDLDPATLQITPTFALAGPPSTLTEFASSHIQITQNTRFTVTSASRRTLPDNLNEAAVQQILLSLAISTDYKTYVLGKLSGTDEQARQRKCRFRQQLPWQLLQHAHARHLQQHLSPTAFDLIRQVLDMPDAIARQAVQGAGALIRPLELIKTAGASAIKALGLYLIGSSTDAQAPYVLYSPYHAGQTFTEFKDETSVVAAFNLPGALQDLLLRRLPDSQQALFRNLFSSTAGAVSEITLASNPIKTNLIDTLFNDNTLLLSDMLTTQTKKDRQFDWETVLHLFSAGIRLAGRQLPGKLTFIDTLWESYQDFKGSAEALRVHDWKTGLHDFIAGAAQMVSLGFLNRDDTFGLLDPIVPAAPKPSATTPPPWKDIATTAPLRINLQVFEATGVSLHDLEKTAFEGIYADTQSSRFFVPLMGKVFQVVKARQAWRIIHENGEGPLLKRSDDRRQWVIDPERHTIRYGKVMSTLAYSYSDYKAAGSLNIEARGMKEIRRKYPRHAQIIVQGLETARYYCFNALHNLEQARRQVHPGSRLDTYLRSFFGVNPVDESLIRTIHAAVSPICQALADPSWELQNANRIVMGSLRNVNDRATAFVIEPQASGRIYLTELFFDAGLDWYRAVVPQSFNVDAHAQGATLIHEISHQLFDTLDIIYLDAPLPFLDLISRSTQFGRQQYDRQKELQQNGLSLTTPRSRLFMEWDNAANSFKSLEAFPQNKDTVREILKMTGARTMNEARDVFLDSHLAQKRIDVILRNADSMTLLICELGRQLDSPTTTPESGF
ncbi:hypothetical protein PflQ2_2683 [Pseudomonas fluorescens Q2-87]|uniref:Dermonecrotic toxin N-terminal domain-containing protein n=1 Tax=Pseudomonas fluorescens (strain Q2-87) TaxID=1038922 RepID=J2F8V9_PSEFQ|nr:DUF6543 domain-containing protein [Pseudomonas fluorescens]EJL05568.1 hypothetical protein PflQ2_2683 [Pseudomonas fluorescens Q2-87]